MELMKSLMIAASGLKAQSGRMRIIAENLANRVRPRHAGRRPYRRKMVTFENVFNRELGAHVVRPGESAFDQTDFGRAIDPGHPAADERGYVKTPNVNTWSK